MGHFRYIPPVRPRHLKPVSWRALRFAATRTTRLRNGSARLEGCRAPSRSRRRSAFWRRARRQSTCDSRLTTRRSWRAPASSGSALRCVRRLRLRSDAR